MTPNRVRTNHHSTKPKWVEMFFLSSVGLSG